MNSNNLQLMYFTQGLSTDPTKASQLFPVKNYGLEFKGSDYHRGQFTLGCKLAQRTLEFLTQRSQQEHIIQEKRKHNFCGSSACLTTGSVLSSYSQGLKGVWFWNHMNVTARMWLFYRAVIRKGLCKKTQLFCWSTLPPLLMVMSIREWPKEQNVDTSGQNEFSL